MMLKLQCGVTGSTFLGRTACPLYDANRHERCERERRKQCCRYWL